MEAPEKESLTVAKAAENLAAFAIDRTDLKQLLSVIPEKNDLNLTTVEYELALLKIISTGWAISFYMPVSDKNKAPLSQTFWEMIREISGNISTITETTTGTQVDYFNILKERLDLYVEGMKSAPDQTTEPVAVMGPLFAKACNSPGDPMAVLTGTKMFTLTLGAVKEYLEAVDIQEIKYH